MSDTIVQIAVGVGNSTNQLVNTGFWQTFSVGGCCFGAMYGNVNGDSFNQIDLSDLVFLVSYAFQDGIETPFSISYHSLKK